MTRKRVESRAKCTHLGCRGLAYPFTDPPLCRVHKGPLDDWYGSALLLISYGPKAKREWAEALAHEIYIHDLISTPPARTFFGEFETAYRKQEGAGESEVGYRFLDVVYFFAAAAAAGVTGNLAYDSLRALVRRVRRLKQEIGTVSFEAVVSRSTYDRVRRREHPGKAPSRSADERITHSVRKRYSLVVTLKRTGRDR